MDSIVAKNPRIVPVLLAGGVGARLWPLSREAHPKPFIKLDDGHSLIQKAYMRALAIEDIEEVITVTNRDLFFYTKDEYEEVSSKKVHNSFLLEPCGRNSSAAVALAAHYIKEQYGDDCIMLVLPADHLIDKPAQLVKALKKAVILAQGGKLVTFGITPHSPKTGYGYIEADGNFVKRFVEKPSFELAQQYISAGNYFWNSGMFCMRAGSILEEMNELCPDIAGDTFDCLRGADRSKGEDWLQIEIGAKLYESVRDISIDYSVFEVSDKVAIVPCDIGWSDIGSWVEFGKLHPKDDANNHVRGDTELEDVSDCVVHSESRLVAGVGLKDLIIADTQDALLVAHKDRAQDVRKIVSALKKKNNKSYQSFPTVHRPWGTYTILLEGQGFKLKRIEVKPGAALSLHSHNHRSEHWVVVSGIAKLTNGSSERRLEHNQSTYIAAGSRHRLENPQQEKLILIEVQCGDYLSEDDIVQHEDTHSTRELEI